MRNLLTALGFCALFITAPVPGTSQTKPTTAEVKKFGLFIDSLASIGEWDKIGSEYFDLDSFGGRILRGISLSETDRKDFMTGFKKSGAANNITSEIKKQASAFTFLKVVERHQEKRALFRMETSENAINYMEFYIVKNNKNQLRVADMYSYILMDDVSASLKALVQQLDAEETSGNTASDNAKIVKSMREAQKAGNFQKVLTLYNQLSPENKKMKLFLTMRMNSAQQLDEQLYKTAMDDFYNAFPDEPGINFLLIDRYFLEGEYAKTLIAVNKVDSLVGGDPYLELYRGNLYVSTGDYDKAEASMERFVKYFPKKEAGYPTYVSLLIANGKYKAAVENLKKWEKETGQNPQEYLSIEDFPEFAESPEYKAYAAGR